MQFDQQEGEGWKIKHSHRPAAETMSKGMYPSLSELQLTCSQNFAADLKSLNDFTSENHDYYYLALKITPQGLFVAWA